MEEKLSNILWTEIFHVPIEMVPWLLEVVFFAARLKVMNRSFYFGMILSVALQMLALFGPLGEVLHIRPVEPIHLALISITAFVIPIGTCELHKLLSRRQARGFGR